MSYEAARGHIETRWATGWVGGSPLAARTPTQYQNVQFTPPENAPFARLTIVDADAAQISAGDPGNNVHRHTGVIVVEILDVYGRGTAGLRRFGDQAAAIFRNAKFGNVRALVPVVTMREASGSRCAAVVTVPFYFDDLL